MVYMRDIIKQTLQMFISFIFSSFYFIKNFYLKGQIISFTVLPSILPFSYDEEINIGDSVELVCQVTKGDMPVQITWSFHGSTTNQSELGKMKTQKISGKSSLFTISQASPQNSGTYTCKAKNRAGVVNYSTNITINGRI